MYALIKYASAANVRLVLMDAVCFVAMRRPGESSKAHA